jgi:putative tricarboxylic transport membrane protein
VEFIQYLPEVFSGWNLVILVLGTIGGLLLLIMLGAVYTSTVAGGAVSAILVNIPGAPANIATILDGHPMAQKGRAAEALHYCFISSFIGGAIGILVLIFFTPLLANFALNFGPSELFWVAILGVTVIGSLGSKSLWKGLFAGALGLWLSTIGYDPVVGEERFVVTDHLAGGINIIAALIGLFAIPQVLSLLETAVSGEKVSMYQLESQSVWRSLNNNVRQIKALVIGSLSGVLVGLIPGAGGQIAGLIAYDQNKKFSRDRERFGKGEPTGVMSAESANNAMVGPSLVPMLTLGIPGSPTAAVLLGGLLIHGLFPGPDLFRTHAETTWVFIDSLLVGQLLMVIFGLSISRYSRFVTRIPKNFMAAAVTVLAVFGTYSVQNSYSDVLVMVTLGTAMYFGMKVGFSPAPMVLGIILGPIAETNYVQGKIIAESGDGLFNYFLTGNINLLMVVACFASIIYSIVTEVRTMRARRGQEL